MDGKEHEYKLDLPVGGMNWSRFILTGINFPAEVTISGMNLFYPRVDVKEVSS